MPQRYSGDPTVTSHELEDMQRDLPQVIKGDWYDVKLLSTTPDGDGGVVSASTYIETVLIDVQPIQWSQRESKNRVEVEIGGVKYIPTSYGFISFIPRNNIPLITATHFITKDSGTHNLVVLRTYPYEDHIEMDLSESQAGT